MPWRSGRLEPVVACKVIADRLRSQEISLCNGPQGVLLAIIDMQGWRAGALVYTLTADVQASVAADDWARQSTGRPAARRTQMMPWM